MIHALRISIGDITYENVKIILSSEINDMGFDPIFGEHTIMFRDGLKWHACHDWNLKLIHISRDSLRIPQTVPFERLVIDSNKIYGPGKFASHSVLTEHGIDDIWDHKLERQVAFSCQEGVFITTDYAIDNLIFHPGYTHMVSSIESVSAHSIHTNSTNINQYVRRSGVRSCRSTLRRTP